MKMKILIKVLEKNSMKFRELYNLLEAVRETTFIININSTKYTITRDWHLLQNRNGEILNKKILL